MIVDKIKKRENKNISNKKSNIDIPIGKWIKCDKCKEIIYKETKKLLDDKEEYNKMSRASNPYGDGFTSKYIVDAIIDKYTK